ncbi:MAG: VWA domain-containing protein [Candidatus Latescibacterota bacterium]|nr:MAG: VWA domain-containing protein [Candidatus Latescibacterota bacterium]
MGFANPEWLNALYLLPPLAILFFYGARRRRRDLLAFTGSELSESLSPGRSWRKGLLKGALRIIGFACLVIGLAGPQIGSQLVKVEREGIDLVIALDTSLSMLAEDMKPSRLERAKQEIVDLIDGLMGDRLGIVVFAGDAFVLCPLNVDYDAALMFAQTADIDVVSKPGSAIGKAIEKSVALFPEERKSDRVIILVTDGESHEDDPADAARKAAGEGIRIYTIGIGNPAGELIPLRGTDGSIDGYKKDNTGETVLTRLDEATLQRVAKITGGQYLPATREGIELKVLYKEISGLEKKTIKGEFMEAKKDRFIWFLASAFLFLGLDAITSSRASARKRRGRRVLHTGMVGILALITLVTIPQSAFSKGVDRKRVKSGNRYYDAGEYRKALVLYKEALGDTTKIPEGGEGVVYNQANALHMMGEYQSALQKYHESLSEDTVQTGRMFYNRGNTLMKTGKIPDAAESYLQALRYLPDDLDARHNLELALLQLQQQQQQQQQQQDNQRKQDQEDQPKDSQDAQSEEDRQREQQDRPDEQESQDEQQDQQSEEPDSLQTPPSQPDSSAAQPQQPDSMQVIELSRGDALRLLRLLEEQEKELQKQKRKAAFKRVRKSGKDW